MVDKTYKPGTTGASSIKRTAGAVSGGLSPTSESTVNQTTDQTSNQTATQQQNTKTNETVKQNQNVATSGTSQQQTNSVEQAIRNALTTSQALSQTASQGTTRGTSQTTGIADTNNVQNINKVTDNMDPATRQAFTQFLSQLVGGQNAGVNQQMQSQQAMMKALQTQLQATDPTRARQMAEGNIADLGRQLAEKVLPGIMGQQEAAGGSNSALSQLLAQDASSRTAEAQQRAILEATLGLGNQAANLTQIGLQAANQQDPATAAMLAALGIGTGSMATETGTVTEQGRTVTNEQTQQLQQQQSTEQTQQTQQQQLQEQANTMLSQLINQAQQQNQQSTGLTTSRGGSSVAGSSATTGNTSGTTAGTTTGSTVTPYSDPRLVNLAAMNSVLGQNQFSNLIAQSESNVDAKNQLTDLYRLFGVR